MEFIQHDANFWFAVSLAIMLVLFVLEVVGMVVGVTLDSVFGVDIDGSFDIDGDADADFTALGVLHWLGVGKVPTAVFLVIVLFFFGAVGLGLNLLVFNNLGYMLPLYASIPAALIVSLPFVKWSCGFLARVIPSEETSAVRLEDLVGSVAVVTIGTATNTRSAPARVIDKFGELHSIMVRTLDKGVKISERAGVRLDHYDPQGFFLVTPVNKL